MMSVLDLGRLSRKPQGRRHSGRNNDGRKIEKAGAEWQTFYNAVAGGRMRFTARRLDILRTAAFGRLLSQRVGRPVGGMRLSISGCWPQESWCLRRSTLIIPRR